MMLTLNCIHPKILRVVSLCAHGGKILISDGNYPLNTRTGMAEKVYLGLTAGVPEVTQVLQVLCSALSFEKAEVMIPGRRATGNFY